MNLTHEANQENHLAELSYHCKADDVTISIAASLDKQIEEYNSNSTNADFHHLLIETFLQQIDAKIEIDQTNNNSFAIRSTKSNTITG